MAVQTRQQTMQQLMQQWAQSKPTGILVLQDGLILEGKGVGATGHAVGEVCFNTAMTGYQEIITDPSYAGQIITFTFPHIGNVGTNPEDNETSNSASTTHHATHHATQGIIIREDITAPANYRAFEHLDSWLKQRGLIGLAGVDTRALTRYIRENGMFNATIAHDPEGAFDIATLKQAANDFTGLEGLDLSSQVTTPDTYEWTHAAQGGRWAWGKEMGKGFNDTPQTTKKVIPKAIPKAIPKVVAIDFGIKQNILRCLAMAGMAGCDLTIVPATTKAEDVLAMNPDGVFLSNGPGDPAATGKYAVPEIKKIVASGKPVFGICLGHQLLALALGAGTEKMPQGHHGANHPVKDMTTGKVEITAMNHGFTVKRDSLPANVEETHISLFDGTNCGIQLKNKPVFSVQHHPEASPGPQDSHYLFDRFVEMMNDHKEDA